MAEEVRMPVRLDHLLQRGAPEAPALTYRDETLSYRELGTRVAACAEGLRRIGLDRGDRVLVYLEKRLETVVAVLAASRAGLVVVPVNSLWTARQVAYVIDDCEPRAVITSTERHEALRPGLAEARSVDHVIAVGARPVTPPGPGEGPPVVAWSSVAPDDGPAGPGAEEVTDADVAAVLYTSGSTGGPKGVVLSHRNLLVGAESVAAYLGHTAEDVVLAVLPLSFDAGLSQVTTALAAGAHVVLVNYVLPREVVRLCSRHRVTALTAVPPLWLKLVDQEWPPEAVRHLRYFANTGGHMPTRLLTRLRRTFPHARPYLMYGLTEAFRSTYLDPDEVDRRPESIGKAIPNAEVLVVRPDGSTCDPGEEGEIVHRGPLVSLGYWNDPERTAARFRPLGCRGPVPRTEVVVWSGDVGVRDEEDFLYVLGRRDSMIKTSGYRVSPTEVEVVAYETGLVTEALAFGMPDEEIGQQVVLAVGVGTHTSAEQVRPALDTALRAELPRYMHPRRLLVTAVLPRTPNGKFDTSALREEVAR